MGHLGSAGSDVPPLGCSELSHLEPLGPSVCRQRTTFLRNGCLCGVAQSRCAVRPPSHQVVAQPVVPAVALVCIHGCGSVFQRNVLPWSRASWKLPLGRPVARRRLCQLGSQWDWDVQAFREVLPFPSLLQKWLGDVSRAWRTPEEWKVDTFVCTG